MSHSLIHQNPWQNLREFTSARIGLGRAGNSLPTSEVLKFGLAHAQARDAVHLPLDTDTLTAQLQAQGYDVIQTHSAAANRDIYLRRPDLGRMLDETTRENLRQQASQDPVDLLIVIGDGLSSTAIQQNTVPFLAELQPRLDVLGLTVGPLILATQSRVALGDDIAETMNARAVAILIGERPGLSSPDSMGIYLTWKPHRGIRESLRNCISNIRPEGLHYPDAAHKLSWLLAEAFRRQISGIALKDESDDAADILLTAQKSTIVIHKD
jgi:ethanolamine ammonia-lyase small subunit